MARIDDDGQVIYRGAYPETDSLHLVSAGRSEEFLFLQNECAPRAFEYELSALSAGTRVTLVDGEVRFTSEAGHGVKIEAPWLIEVTGKQPAGAVRWELEKSKSGALPRLRLVVAPGLRYPVVVDPSWSLTGSMSTARYSHTATLLPSGQVLVAGGVDDTPMVVSSAELYDPATRTWMATGNMGVPREAHTATLLASGKVLVAAGYGTAPLSSAELYDPVTGTWTATGSLAQARFGYTATLLPNGQVLVAGGNDSVSGFHELSSAELYDPATETWRATGSLAQARQSHTATLLRNGQVLVVGGYNGTSLSSAELYDPRTRIWTATGSMGTSRNVPSATLLPNGQVLVAGGFSYTSGFLRSAELYDATMGTWTATGIMLTARASHTATLLLSGKVLVTGGRYRNFSDTRGTELYDPASGTWRTSRRMQTARQDHTATLLPSGDVLVAGGQNPGEGSDNQILNEAELSDPTTVSQITPAENQVRTDLK
jgi:N-acetylneuraminic acid mutarotase